MMRMLHKDFWLWNLGVYSVLVVSPFLVYFALFYFAQ